MITRNTETVPKPTALNPGAELIRDELEHRGIKAIEAARAMSIPRQRLSDIFGGRKGISADTAMRLQRYLGISAQLLIQLQADHDYRKAYHEQRATIEAEVEPCT